MSSSFLKAYPYVGALLAECEELYVVVSETYKTIRI